jgi:type VI secretion system secreted protein VgrG
VVSSPAGIALTTPAPTTAAGGDHLALSSTGHTSMAAGKRLLASASQACACSCRASAYAWWRPPATSISAAEGQHQPAGQARHHRQRRPHHPQGQDRAGGAGGSGTITTPAASPTSPAPTTPPGRAVRPYRRGASLAGTFPEPPGKGALELFNLYANTKGIKAGDYEVTDALGTVLKGALDGQGFNTVSGAAPGPAMAKFGLDTADTWSIGSFAKGLPWPAARGRRGHAVAARIDVRQARPTAAAACWTRPSNWPAVA